MAVNNYKETVIIDGTTPVSVSGTIAGGTVGIQGTMESGLSLPVKISSLGHMKVDLKQPDFPFGSIHTEPATILFQADGVYGVSTSQHSIFTSGSAGTNSTSNLLTVTTGATTLSKASIESRKRLRYRPGQGSVARFTAVFPTGGVASAEQMVGLSNEENTLAVGYSGTDFGLFYRKGGVRAIYTLTVTTKSSTAENITITLNGTAFPVAVTNGTNTTTTAYEISRGAYNGWAAQQVGATVVFLSNSANTTPGAFTLSGATTAVGTFAQTLAGAAVTTNTFIKKSDWNNDKMDGSLSVNNPSGMNLDPTKLNIFQIGVQYLGAGVLILDVGTVSSRGDFDWSRAHTILNPNTLTIPNFSNPSFPFVIRAQSLGSTTPITVSSASYCGFIEGRAFLQGPRFNYNNTITTVGATNMQCLLTIRNDFEFASKVSQVVSNLVSLSVSVKHTNTVIFYLVRDAVLAGTPNFTAYGSISATSWDTAATTCTASAVDKIIFALLVGPDGSANVDLDQELERVTLQPGETITIAAKATTGTPAYATASINTREDQ